MGLWSSASVFFRRHLSALEASLRRVRSGKQLAKQCEELNDQSFVLPDPSNSPNLNEISSQLSQVLSLIAQCFEIKSVPVHKECIEFCQKLIEYGYINGTCMASFSQYLKSESKKNKDKDSKQQSRLKTANVVTTLVLNTYSNSETTLHLPILQTVLAACTSPVCALHGDVLVASVKTCFHVYLYSTDFTMTFAMTSLSQILATIFGKMESVAILAKAEEEAKAKQVFERIRESNENKKNTDEISHSTKSLDENRCANAEESNALNVQIVKIADNKEESKEEDKEDKEEDKEDKEEDKEGKEDSKEENKEENKEEAEEKDKEDKEDTVGKQDKEIIKEEPVKEQKEVISDKNKKLDSPRKTFTPSKFLESVKISLSTHSKDLVLCKNDCFRLFKTMCKLSVKTEDSETVFVNKTKVISFELIEVMLKNSGECFRNDDQFTEILIKNHLVSSLLMNGNTTINSVTHSVLSILLYIVRVYKEELKHEIGVIISNLLLRSLETPHSPIAHKDSILRFFFTLSKDPKLLLDLYLNYDCDLESNDIFERMVNTLSHLAQTTFSAQPNGNVNAGIYLHSLECLVSILSTISKWCDESNENESSNENEKKSDNKENENENENENEKDNEAEAEVSQYDPVSVRSFGSPSLSLSFLQTDDDMKKLNEKKHTKKLLEVCRSAFSRSYKNGISLFIKNGFLADDEPETVAKFILETDLDKNVLGDLLGANKEWNKKVMGSFVGLQDFTGMEIDTALRAFLGRFRMPGEAPIVDRFMENFGAKYYHDNPNSVFKDADAVYMFCFATIMCATDLHSPVVKNKITLQDFIKMVNTHIALALDEEYISKVFDRISAKPIELSASLLDPTNIGIVHTLDLRERKLVYMKETSQWIDLSMKLVKDQTRRTTNYYHSSRIECVRPMFQSMWSATIVALSLLLERSDDDTIVDLCLCGFDNAIHIASIHLLQTERTAFVSALEKFTNLQSTSVMQLKHIKAVHVLLNAAQRDGDYLQNSWECVLRALALLAHLHSIGRGDSLSFARNEPSGVQSQPIQPAKSFGNEFRKNSSFETMISKRVSIDEVTIDQIYANSVSLNNKAIVHFVRSLCFVSTAELEMNPPRLFSLQKVIEVASYNMERMRFVWSEIWQILREHFALSMFHSVKEVALFALDALRQLSFKFLEKDELSNYNFQKEFLRPFEVVMNNTAPIELQEMVMHCMHRMAQKSAQNLHSGWKSLFSILSIGSKCEDRIVLVGIDAITEIVNTHFNTFAQTFFIEGTQCVVSYCTSSCLNANVNIRALQLLYKCVQSAVDDQSLHLNDFNNEQLSGKMLNAWVTLLRGFTQTVSHENSDVRANALTLFCKILTEFGSGFSVTFWKYIFKGIVLPMLAVLTHTSPSNRNEIDNEFLSTTCRQLLSTITLLCSQFFGPLSESVGEVFDIFGGFIKNDNTHFASLSSAELLHFLDVNANSLASDHWKRLCERIKDILTHYGNVIYDFFEEPICEKIQEKQLEDNSQSLEENKQSEHKIESKCVRCLSTIPHNPVHCFFCAQSLFCSEKCRELGLQSHFETNCWSVNDLLSHFVSAHKQQRHDLHSLQKNVDIFITNIKTIESFCLRLPRTMHVKEYSMILKAFDEISLKLTKVRDSPKGKEGIPLLERVESEMITTNIRILFALWSETENDCSRKHTLAKERMCSVLLPSISVYVRERESTFTNPIVILFIESLLALSDIQYLSSLPMFYLFLTELIKLTDERISSLVSEHFIRIGYLTQIVKKETTN